jgi:cyanophycin synthetase
MYSHRCSGVAGGFFSREGTWMGHVIEHIALEIQTLAGMDTAFPANPRPMTKGYIMWCSLIGRKKPVYMLRNRRQNS